MSKKKPKRFFNRYDFAYTGRHTVNQVGKIAPGLIKMPAQKSITLPNKE